MKEPCVYLLASQKRGTLYTGVTSDLAKRIHQHRTGEVPGFSSRYTIRRLVWFERHDEMEHAIAREKRIKKWERPWKFRLVEEGNPGWRDLAVSVLDFEPLHLTVPHRSPPARG